MAEAERRPLASRERKWAQDAAHFLAVRGVTPNSISAAGMLAGVLAGVAFASTRVWDLRTAGFLAGAVFVQLRLLCNMLDGMVALEQQTASPLGSLYNEVPDRVSDAATLIGAGYAFDSSPTLGYLTAVLAVFIAYLRVQGRLSGAPQDFCGPMAKPHRMFAITLTALIAAFLWIRVTFEQTPGEKHTWGVMAAGLLIILVGEIVTVFRRLSRIVQALQDGAAETLGAPDASDGE